MKPIISWTIHENKTSCVMTMNIPTSIAKAEPFKKTNTKLPEEAIISLLELLKIPIPSTLPELTINKKNKIYNFRLCIDSIITTLEYYSINVLQPDSLKFKVKPFHSTIITVTFRSSLRELLEKEFSVASTTFWENF